MRYDRAGSAVAAIAIGLLTALPAAADPFFFSTGDPDGLIATAARPDAGGKFEIESADDFVLTRRTQITGATFTGLLTGTNPAIDQVVVEIYRVFPNDSDVSRTSGPPTFSTSKVPTRVNSPSDVELDGRDSAAATLTFSTTTLQATFSALNSVQPGGIRAVPSQMTGGDGVLTGQEVRLDVRFTTPFVLQAGHYFFVPQVSVPGAGEFLWLSAPKPIVPPGTPFAPDLQSWTRDAFLDPDWLRVGTDIVGAGAFNAAFSLNGQTVPEPASLGLLGTALSAMTIAGLRRRRAPRS